MITEIKEAELDVMENPYPGMNLAEACNKFQMDTMQLMNDFQMGVLLSEHAYLYENGTEIEYVDEAGNLTERGKQLRDKAIEKIRQFGKWVAELWDKCIQWVSDRIDQIVDYFKKASISKKHVEMARKAIKEIYGDDGLVISGVKQTVTNYPEFYSAATNAITYEINDKGEKVPTGLKSGIYDEYVHKYEGDFKVTENVFNDAAKVVFDKTNVIKQIREKKKKMISDVNGLINTLKSPKQDSENGDSNFESEIKEKTDMIADISAGAHEAIKVYHAYVNEKIAIIRGVFADKEIKKNVIGQVKADVKAAPGKAVEAGREAANKAGTAVKDAGKAVVDTANKAGTAVKDAGKSVKRATGKFFKVPGKKEEA